MHAVVVDHVESSQDNSWAISQNSSLERLAPLKMSKTMQYIDIS